MFRSFLFRLCLITIVLGNFLFSYQALGQSKPEIKLLSDGKTEILLWADQEIEIELSEGERFLLRRREEEVQVYKLDDSGNKVDEQLIFQHVFTPIPDYLDVRLDDDYVDALLVDANFDGMRDILIFASGSFSGVDTNYHLYLNSPVGLPTQPSKIYLPNPQFDPVKKQIRISARVGLFLVAEYYRVENGQWYTFLKTSARFLGYNYARFFNNKGELERDMITASEGDDPQGWQPLHVVLPKDQSLVLYQDSDNESPTIGTIRAGSEIILRRFNEDFLYTYIESLDSSINGWVQSKQLSWMQQFEFAL